MTEVTKLTKLEQRETELREQLADIYKAIKDERTRVAFAKYGVTIGTVVISKGVEYRVSKVDCRWNGKPWLEGNPRRKDGTFGTARRNLYENWERA